MEQKSLSHSNMARAAGMIAGMILISRILGFVRESLSGRLFVRAETDAFIAAFVIPDFMYYLLVGGALSAAFIPLFTEYLTKKEEDEGWKMASTFINITFIILAVLAVLGMIFARQLAPLEAYKFTGSKLILLTNLTRLMFPAVFFTAMAGLMAGVLNSYQYFFAPAAGPLIYNIAIIGGAYFLGTKYGIRGMAIGVVIGAFGNFVAQAYMVSRKTKGYIPFYINLRHPGFKRMLMLMLPAVLGLSATQINIWMTNTMASGLPEGSITALRFANRLILLPLGIFAMAISTAFFPSLSRLTAEGRWDDFKKTLALGVRMILFITVPCAIGFFFLRTDIVRILFQGQKFTAHDTAATAYALMFYCIGLFAHGTIQILPRGFYSLKDTLTPVLTTVTGEVFSFLLNLILLRYTKLAQGGFALSFSLMGILVMTLSIIRLRKKIGSIEEKSMAKTFGLSLFASSVMGLVIYIFRFIFQHYLIGMTQSQTLQSLIMVAGGMFLGILVFLGVAFALKMEEVKLLVNMLGRRRAKES
ncbi:MAG TPA: murein biosynthesis integral membrane protein MurJ [Bacillota bacterium]|nr:murein biosynthesis integral membrane protein MurJ [Bacillota bacterium]